MGTDSATNNREQSNQTEANDDKIKRFQETSAQASKSKVVIIGDSMLLNNSGLHLNKQGTAALAKNIKQCLISHHNI